MCQHSGGFARRRRVSTRKSGVTADVSHLHVRLLLLHARRLSVAEHSPPLSAQISVTNLRNCAPRRAEREIAWRLEQRTSSARRRCARGPVPFRSISFCVFRR